MEQCFLVEQPQGTLVVVDYELPEFAKQKVNLVANLKSGPTGANTKMIQQVDMDQEQVGEPFPSGSTQQPGHAGRQAGRQGGRQALCMHASLTQRDRPVFV